MTEAHLDRCRVYRGRGDCHVVSNDLGLEPPDGPARVADRTPIRSIMSRDLVCARPDLDVAQVLLLVVQRRIGCLPVIDERRRPVGIVTKYDLVEQLEVALCAAADGAPLPPDLAARTVDDLMMPIAFTIDEHATVAHAAAMMAMEDTHHVLVVDAEGALVGVVSAHDIVRWVVGASAQTLQPSTP